MIVLPDTIQSMFAAVGWARQCSDTEQTRDGSSADARVAAVLTQFAGLHVGQCGPGTHQAASGVSFYGSPRTEVSAVLSPWKSQVGECAAFATAHHDHMILFISGDGTYFSFTDTDERLYRFNGGFSEFMEALLFGYPFGESLSRDAQPLAASDGFAAR